MYFKASLWKCTQSIKTDGLLQKYEKWCSEIMVISSTIIQIAAYISNAHLSEGILHGGLWSTESFNKQYLQFCYRLQYAQ